MSYLIFLSQITIFYSTVFYFLTQSKLFWWESLFLEGDLPSSIYTQQHCSVKSEFGYFPGGCFTDRSLVHSPATGGRQFKKEHQVQKADDGAVDVLQKS